MEALKIYIIDIVLLLIFIVCVVYYYRKGFVRSILEFCSFFVSALLTKMYSPAAADWLIKNTDFFNGVSAPQAKANLISVIVIFIAASVLLRVIIGLIDKFFTLPVIKTANKALGLLVGAICGFLLVSAVTLFINVLNLTGYAPLETAVANSKIMELDSQLTASLFPAAAELIKGGFQK